MKATNTYLRFLCEVTQDMQALAISFNELETPEGEYETPQGDTAHLKETINGYLRETLRALNRASENLNEVADFLFDTLQEKESDSHAEREEAMQNIQDLRRRLATGDIYPRDGGYNDDIQQILGILKSRKVQRIPDMDQEETIEREDMDMNLPKPDDSETK